jgi:hypothetical protein
MYIALKTIKLYAFKVRVVLSHVTNSTRNRLYLKVNWAEKQWVKDGNIWTAGGACARIDMMAH